MMKSFLRIVMFSIVLASLGRVRRLKTGSQPANTDRWSIR
jgi:hypothetical protein